MSIDADRIQDAVDAPVTVFGETTNTTDTLRDQGRDGAPHGTFAIAEALTSAVGRDGSTWIAPPGGVWSSTLLRPSFGRAHVGRLTFAGGLAVAEAIEQFGVDARLKWPNDVVCEAEAGPQKLAGVLVEPVTHEAGAPGKPVDGTGKRSGLEFVLLGVGVNADLDPVDLSTDRAATTMRAEVGPVDPTNVAVTLHERLLARAADADTERGFAAVLDEWRDQAVTLNERVRVERHEGPPLTGDAVDVREDGALVVQTESTAVAVTSGEVEQVRRV